MAIIHEPNQAQIHEANGASEVEQRANQVKSLQDECVNLREALAKTKEERDRYLKALYENMRGSFPFQDVTLSELERISAGPVEFDQ